MRLCKRIIDVLMSLIGLVLAAPLMAAIAAALWIEAPGEVIFAQERLGRHGKRFRLYKFRKFAPDIGTSGTGVTVAGDARMTALGRILERTKFDELPQLWNILKGEMSFVGPRPETPRFADLFEGEFAKVLDYTPGIFGPNQVAFRNESAMYPPDEDPEAFYRRELFPAKARNDLEYFARANCWRDLAWIARGVWASVAGVLDWRRMASLHMASILLDWVSGALAWSAAWAFRYGWMDAPDWELWRDGLMIFPPVLWLALILGGCYAHPVRAFSLSDATRLLLASLIGWLVAFLILIAWVDRGVSILLAPLGWLCAVPILIGPRVVRRILTERDAIRRGGARRQSKRVLIAGANRLGEALKDWAASSLPDVEIVGFLDDTPGMVGKRIRGVRVLGRGADLATVCERCPVDEIWLVAELGGNLRAQASGSDIKVINILAHAPFSSHE